MIDLEKATNEFINYTNNYNLEESQIKLKKEHTFRVMELSKNIAESLNLSEEDIKLASLIGLLHDLARFEQWKLYKTFSDGKSVDHGDLAVKILEENEYIKNYVEDSKYYDIIKLAVKNHNKFKIQDGLDEKTLLHSKIVRDADKLDIFYEGVNTFYTNPEKVNLIESLPIAKDYYDQFIQRKQIFRKKDPTPLDAMVCLISFIFDMNFDYSKKLTLEKNYINDILNKFDFKNEETKVQIEELRNIANEYLKNN